MNFETNFFLYLDTILTKVKTQPLILGGTITGSGGPPGGFVGFLPQSRISYDNAEIASMTIPASATLVDNLNHIRYRVQTLEGGGSSGLSVYKDNVMVASGITVLDFYNATVTNPSLHKVNVTCSGGGTNLSIYDDSTLISSSPTKLSFVSPLHAAIVGDHINITTTASGSVTASGVSYYAWDADAKPETANSKDDEFDDAYFNVSKWTSVDEDGANTYAEDERGLIITPDIAKGGKLAGIVQSIPVGDFSVWTKVLPIGIRDQGVKPVLCLAEDADFTKKFLTMSWTVGGSDYIMQTEYWDDNDNLNTGYDNDSRQWTTSAGYMRMRIIGTKCSMDYSNDGVAWFKFRVIDPIPFTPTKIGLMVRTDGLDEDVKVIFQFFRVSTDTSLASKMEGHKVVRYRV